MATEIEEESRTLEYVRKGFYRGRRCFGCLTGSAAQSGLDLIGADFPSMPNGEEAPKGARFRVTRHPSGKKKFDLLIVEYETSMIGKGLVYVEESVNNLVMPTVPESGAVVEGLQTLTVPGSTPANRKDLYERRVVKGRNVTGESHLQLIVVTAYAAGSVAAVVQKMMALNGRSINAEALTSFIPVAVGHLNWRGSRRIYDRADEFTFHFRMAYNKDGWNPTCTSKAGVWTPDDVPGLDSTGAASGTSAKTLRFHDGYGLDDAGALILLTDQTTPVSPVQHNLFLDGDMAFIDDLVMVV